MSDARVKQPIPRYRKWIGYITIPLVTAALVYVLGSIVDRAITCVVSDRLGSGLEAAGRRDVERQIEQLGTNGPRLILLGNELGQGQMDAFIAARERLDQIERYDLQIWYSQNVDGFLQQIEGQPRIRSLILYRTDVTAAGINAIASLPDLERLRIAYVDVAKTEASERLDNLHLESLMSSLRPLQKAPKLARLELICPPARSTTCASSFRIAASRLSGRGNGNGEAAGPGEIGHHRGIRPLSVRRRFS